MKCVLLSGSPRKDGNTNVLLNLLQSKIGGTIIRLSDQKISYCYSCWKCIPTKQCILVDDFTKYIEHELRNADVIIIASPVYFNNVTSQTKTFIDRTWSLRGKLNNKIGGAIAVGRKYGNESALTAITSSFLKHNMIVSNRGIAGIAFEKDDILKDKESLRAIDAMAQRIKELYAMIEDNVHT